MRRADGRGSGAIDTRVSRAGRALARGVMLLQHFHGHAVPQIVRRELGVADAEAWVGHAFAGPLKIQVAISGVGGRILLQPCRRPDARRVRLGAGRADGRYAAERQESTVQQIRDSPNCALLSALATKRVDEAPGKEVRSGECATLIELHRGLRARGLPGHSHRARECGREYRC